MESAKHAVSDTSVQQRLGKPVLTTVDAIAQSLALGPVFSAVAIAALIAGQAGGAAPLATLISAVAVFALGWVVTLYARRYTGAGAIYDYLRRLSPSLGLFSAGVYFLGAIFEGGAGIYLFLGLTVNADIQTYFNLDVPWWAISIVAAIIILALNHFGVRVTTRGQLTLTTLSVIPLIILAIAIIAKGGAAGNDLQAFSPTISPLSGLFGGLLFGVTLFTGFEASASLSEETAHPRRSIPIAVAGTIALSTVFYLLVVYASDIGFGLSHSDLWAKDAAPLDTLATRYVGKWLAVLIDLALIFDMFAVASAFTATASRGFFALARHHLLPAIFSRQSRFGTPLGGNILVFACALLVIVVTLLLRVDVGTAFGVAAGIGAILILLIYVALVAGAVRILLEGSHAWWQWIVLVVAGVTPLLGLYGTVVPFPAWPLSLEVYGSIAALILVSLWTLVMKFAYPQRLKEAAAPHVWE